jgi:hypothetical protein
MEGARGGYTGKKGHGYCGSVLDMHWISGDSDGTRGTESCSNIEAHTNYRDLLLPGTHDAHIPTVSARMGTGMGTGADANSGQERAQNEDFRLALVPLPATSSSRFSSTSAPPASAATASRSMCAAAPSAAGPGAAASPART